MRHFRDHESGLLQVSRHRESSAISRSNGMLNNCRLIASIPSYYRVRHSDTPSILKNASLLCRFFMSRELIIQNGLDSSRGIYILLFVKHFTKQYPNNIQFIIGKYPTFQG